jgi:formylglycine-generating enzyme required for sulfatase activity
MILRPLIACFLVLAFLAPRARAVTIATVPVGYPGNAADTVVMNDGTSGYGAVPYNYRIGTYDVTNAQYVEFLNAKASAADPYGLWNSSMIGAFDPTEIFRTGAGPYTYSVPPAFANRPVIFVSWYDAVRFVNWLTNGQGNGNTESGSYTITNGGYNSGAVTAPSATQRATWAVTNSFHWLLPSENEWYKAAYYNGTAATYYAYPFQSNAQPAALAPPGNDNSGAFDSQGANQTDGLFTYQTDVGAYPNSLSPFGSFDMGGNAQQWTDAALGGSRVLRGGNDFGSPLGSAASIRNGYGPAEEVASVGFRVLSIGSVPEPASLVLASIGVVGLSIFSKRLRARVCLVAGDRRVSGGCG